MRKERIDRVYSECKRLMERIDELRDVSGGSCNPYPRESGAVRRASMDLTRALADMRKPYYWKLPGDK